MCLTMGILGPHLMIQDCDVVRSFVLIYLLCAAQFDGCKRLPEPRLDLESDSSISWWERDNLDLSPGPFSTGAVYLQSRGCFSLPRAAVELSVTTWLCTSFIRTLSVFWYMSHFIPYNSCTSPTLGLRGLAFSITLVIIFMTLLQYFFSSDMPSAQGTGLLLKGYRYDRWDCDSNVWCTALLGHRQNVCVCFTFVKLLLIPTGKASPAGSFLLSIPSLSALAMKQPCLGESLLGQGERNREPGQKGDPFHMCLPYTWICCFPLHPRQKMGGGGEISSTYW